MAKHNAATFWLSWWALLTSLGEQQLKFISFCLDNELDYEQVLRLAELVQDMKIRFTE